MPKQHEKVKLLREYQKWRRGAPLPHPVAGDVGLLIDWAIKVCEAADNLVNVKGRHHSEMAYKRLELAVNGEEEV